MVLYKRGTTHYFLDIQYRYVAVCVLLNLSLRSCCSDMIKKINLFFFLLLSCINKAQQNPLRRNMYIYIYILELNLFHNYTNDTKTIKNMVKQWDVFSFRVAQRWGNLDFWKAFVYITQPQWEIILITSHTLFGNSPDRKDGRKRECRGT